MQHDDDPQPPPLERRRMHPEVEIVMAAIQSRDDTLTALDPAQRDAAKLELLKMQQSGELAQLAADTEIAKAQAAVNEAEASSGNAYSSSWRRTVGYACVAGLIYSFLVQPLFPWFAALFGKPVPPLPELDTSVLMTLLLGMLGLGGSVALP